MIVIVHSVILIPTVRHYRFLDLHGAGEFCEFCRFILSSPIADRDGHPIFPVELIEFVPKSTSSGRHMRSMADLSSTSNLCLGVQAQVKRQEQNIVTMERLRLKFSLIVRQTR